MELFDKTFNAIEKSLDLRFKRHVVLSSNTANSETPNYKAREIDFAGELEKALGRDEQVLTKTNPQHMDLHGQEGAHIVYDNSTPVGADGNNVDMDINMGKLAANSRSYSNAVDLLNVKLQILRMAARGTGGF
jgi:flagellar basal-body rod protein FlgB